MQKNKIYTFKNIVVAIAITMFFSCGQDAVEEIPYVDYSDFPSAEGKNMLLKYTTSGELKAVLTAKKYWDYKEKEYPYSEFPEGVFLKVYDEQGRVSTIEADYAISYEESKLIDMRGNVNIHTADSIHLEAQQLYWDQNRDWVFTDLPYKSKLPDGTVNNGDGFDANQDFTTLNSRVNKGVQILKE